MTDQPTGTPKVPSGPFALFAGDFNVGKSSIINALLRRSVLRACREESHALPTFVLRSSGAQATFAALTAQGQEVYATSHDEFLSMRSNKSPATALAASLPAVPFDRLVFADTAGTSSDTVESLQISALAGHGRTLFAVVADIEYWSAKHTMDFIAYHREIFGQALVVLANKADCLNMDEIRRICDKAPRRMEAYGISPAPRFFALSARLEASRYGPPEEYRRRIKRAVRERCDAGFDALRVALYEFEAAHEPDRPNMSPEQLFASPLATALIQGEEGGAS